ncbi:hypothetical protein WUBG_15628 [Wuchereria bancrofti]|uniref:Uncharacterized protein n=1 Tax=Wuchereria bancrofti TaxID=6293 RepID=J9AH56_WUCBA|nr:hypothetical protein WUBG_15628 [Wuchereria bancrofti]
MRHIREVAAVTKTSAKLSEREIRRSNISQRLQRNMISATTYIPFTWISDYNDSTWNDTESNMTLTNITIVSAKYKNNLIFGYFELYVLILLAIFIILLLITTSIACYYDCENRRITLSGDKYSNIKKSTAPIVTVKHASKQPDNIHERMIPDVRICNLFLFLYKYCVYGFKDCTVKLQLTVIIYNYTSERKMVLYYCSSLPQFTAMICNHTIVMYNGRVFA